MINNELFKVQPIRKENGEWVYAVKLPGDTIKTFDNQLGAMIFAQTAQRTFDHAKRLRSGPGGEHELFKEKDQEK